MKKKILFIIGALPDYIPYVYNYFKLAESINIEYDVICWNRYKSDEEFPENYHVYQRPTNNDYSPIRKIPEIFRFFMFAREEVKDKVYDLVFTSTIADTVLFTPWLINKYKGRYIFDIRDHSPLLRIGFARVLLKLLLHYSALNVISSDGFKRWLPKNNEYILCHNVGYNDSSSYASPHIVSSVSESLNIITIGSLRDFDSNSRIINEFANQPEVLLRFAGTGSEQFMTYCAKEGIKNILITDAYKKDEEDDIVRGSDMINLFLPHTINSDSCMGNRMYLAARLRKPLIVTSGSYQAEIVEKYNLGVCVDWDDDIQKKVINYWKTLDKNKFNHGCSEFLNQVHVDMQTWKNRVVDLFQ